MMYFMIGAVVALGVAAYKLYEYKYEKPKKKIPVKAKKAAKKPARRSKK